MKIERQIERLAQDYAMALYGDEIDVLLQVAETLIQLQLGHRVEALDIAKRAVRLAEQAEDRRSKELATILKRLAASN
ncbi:hypothetical protein [Polyangium spumosum]|uniref:Uncharacterized protein n=1 Tax=Polyangium spumosum TaxID=889282 RepID=A0A6N7Q0M8_9BACT|nr:hypothetical protein [Polyangium spumosum]MRG94501.1 hypothetical protein [Polyangium spumosum]